MPAPSLPFPFPPITFEYISNAKQAGETIGYNTELKHLWRILMLAGGWGNVQQQPVLAELLYESVDTARHPNAALDGTMVAQANPQRSKKGTVRFENILSGKRPVTRREAEAFHKALRSGFGQEWSTSLDMETFVMMSVTDFLSEISRRQLSWPSSLDNARGIEILLSAQGNQGLTINPVFADAFRAGFSPGSPNADLVAADDLPAFLPGQKYELLIEGLSEEEYSCFVFELCPDGVRFPTSEESFEVLPITSRKVTASTLLLQPTDGPYTIGAACGRFEFVAVAAKAENPTLSELFADGDAPFAPNKTRRFAEVLRKATLSRNSEIRMARFGYRVV